MLPGSFNPKIQTVASPKAKQPNTTNKARIIFIKPVSPYPFSDGLKKFINH
jgi:hypothetical protein